MSGLVFRCSCGGQAKVEPGDVSTATAEVVVLVKQAHLAQGHHEVDVAEFRQIRRNREAVKR